MYSRDELFFRSFKCYCGVYFPRCLVTREIKKQNNPLVGAETVGHSSTYSILYKFVYTTDQLCFNLQVQYTQWCVECHFHNGVIHSDEWKTQLFHQHCIKRKHVYSIEKLKCIFIRKYLQETVHFCVWDGAYNVYKWALLDQMNILSKCLGKATDVIEAMCAYMRQETKQHWFR